MRNLIFTVPFLRIKGQTLRFGITKAQLFLCLGFSYFAFKPKSGLITTLVFVASMAVFYNTPGVRAYLPSADNAELLEKEQTGRNPAIPQVRLTNNTSNPSKTTSTANVRQRFIAQKQSLIFEYTTKHHVSRTDQLSDGELLSLNRKLSQLFIDSVLLQIGVEAHVLHYFTDSTDLFKLETSLMEQAKFHVPASIKLAQSALETAYGRRVIHNNYFGIKDKAKNSKAVTTTEYYSPEEFKRYRQHVVSYEKVHVKGKTMFKCKVSDHFKTYKTPWESFRDHSQFLSSSSRYAPLFTGGKKYEAWADKIGSAKDGGVGYATSPVYGNLLKSIITRYHLDLLDH